MSEIPASTIHCTYTIHSYLYALINLEGPCSTTGIQMHDTQDYQMVGKDDTLSIRSKAEKTVYYVHVHVCNVCVCTYYICTYLCFVHTNTILRNGFWI